MAMDKDRLGDAIVARIVTFAGIAPSGTDLTQYKNLWRAIADEIIKEITAFQTITIADADFQVLPGTFEDVNPPPATPLIGLGDVKGFSLTVKMS